MNKWTTFLEIIHCWKETIFCTTYKKGHIFYIIYNMKILQIKFFYWYSNNESLTKACIHWLTGSECWTCCHELIFHFLQSKSQWANHILVECPLTSMTTTVFDLDHEHLTPLQGLQQDETWITQQLLHLRLSKTYCSAIILVTLTRGIHLYIDPSIGGYSPTLILPLDWYSLHIWWKLFMQKWQFAYIPRPNED